MQSFKADSGKENINVLSTLNDRTSNNVLKMQQETPS